MYILECNLKTIRINNMRNIPNSGRLAHWDMGKFPSGPQSDGP